MQTPDMKNKLSKWRKKRKITQDQLAEMAGLSRQQLNRIENQKTGFSDEQKEKLANLLGCFPSDFMDDGRLEEEQIGEIITQIVMHVLETREGYSNEHKANLVSKYFLAIHNDVNFDVKMLQSFLKLQGN